MADLQKFRDDLAQLRKSLGAEALKGSCDGYWDCLAKCSTAGCSDGCCKSYSDCCGSAVRAKVNEVFVKHFGPAVKRN